MVLLVIEAEAFQTCLLSDIYSNFDTNNPLTTKVLAILISR
jgi:hypothetical protein